MAMSAIALGTSSCSNDEVTEINKGNEIRFTVTSNKASRAEATTTDNITEFNVHAFNGSEQVTGLIGRTISRPNTGTDEWGYADGTPASWPSTGTLNFFSYSPISLSGSVAVDGNKLKVNAFNCNDGKTDFIYALNTGLSKTDANVNVNFRHALAQVIFKAKNTKAGEGGVEIKVKGVKVCYLYRTANFTWATTSTTTTLYEQTGQETENADGSWGIWAPTGSPEHSGYSTDKFTEPITLTTAEQELINEGATSDIEGETASSALFLIPQQITAWTPVANSGGVAGDNGTYLLINCNIKVNGNTLWPKTGGEGFADVAIPLSSPDDNKWKQGKRYVYTLIFGEGFGYDPETEEPITNTNIGWTVTVDDYQELSSTSNVNMKDGSLATE